MKKNTMKKLLALVMMLYSIETGTDIDEFGNYAPCWVNGVYNPGKAWELRRRLQGKIFSMMKKIGLPLEGWNMFDKFVDTIFRGKSLQAAYRAALSAPPQYIWELTNITEDDTLILKRVED